ncbi:MAG: hypothetical protein ALAOOOJD_04805 [bacterium]|nr:hypothetical protein [bacterium]
MIRFKLFGSVILLCCGLSRGYAQTNERDLKTFGYFQVSVSHEKSLTGSTENKSFSLQQLNLFLQKQLTTNWTAFINFEFVNSYSSFRNWGAHSLEEVWVSYRASNQVKLKLGLQIPTFNNLNQIKNLTPLLPYIIRPLVYETSFNEILELGEFVPGRAFVQMYGYIPVGAAKCDYAVFLGDSQNINSNPARGQTGVDTTRFFLLGGRFGIRTDNLKLGASVTFDKLDLHETAEFYGYPVADFKAVPRLRLGGDLSANLGKFTWESEVIRVTYDDDYPQFNKDKQFYYGTAGYHWTERLFAYGSYWVAREKFFPLQDRDIYASTVGAVYNLNEMIFLKAQLARALFKASFPSSLRETAHYYFCALSVVF